MSCDHVPPVGIGTTHTEHRLAGTEFVVPDLRGAHVTDAGEELVLDFSGAG
jgi:hypothetical protein